MRQQYELCRRCIPDLDFTMNLCPQPILQETNLSDWAIYDKVNGGYDQELLLSRCCCFWNRLTKKLIKFGLHKQQAPTHDGAGEWNDRLDVETCIYVHNEVLSITWLPLLNSVCVRYCTYFALTYHTCLVELVLRSVIVCSKAFWIDLSHSGHHNTERIAPKTLFAIVGT